LAKIIAYASNSQHPSEFTIAPVGAIQKVLDKTGWKAEEVDLWEINEAFAMVTMCPMDEFKLDPEKSTSMVVHVRSVTRLVLQVHVLS
jgi:Acetyl-CoA acetyltransferase